MAALTSDKVSVGAALLAVIVSTGVFGTLAWRHGGAPTGPLPEVELQTTPYTPTAPDAAPVKTETWAAPMAQSRGRDWVYDTFTPPEIFYNTRSKQFTVKPPSSLLDEEPQEAFGVELIAVQPEPFRLQLIGYAGGEGNWRGTFQNAATGEVFLSGGSRRVPNLGVTIKSLEVGLQTVRIGESMSTRQRVATAVVHDEKAGRDMVLTHRDRVFTGTLVAYVAASGESTAREVRIGDTFQLGEATYRIENITASPASVEIAKDAPSLVQTDRQVLTPRDAEESERPDPGSV